MPDRNQHAQEAFDEILAAYSEVVEETSTPSAVPQAEEKELKRLQETILFLHQAAPDEPTQAQANQIKAAVQKAWQNQTQPKPSMVERIAKLLERPAKPAYRSITRRRQIAALRITAAAALVIIAAFIVLPAVGISGGETSGTASGEFGLWALLFSVLLLAGLGLWWWFTSRRK